MKSGDGDIVETFSLTYFGFTAWRMGPSYFVYVWPDQICRPVLTIRRAMD
jgi:hypothetical protein